MILLVAFNPGRRGELTFHAELLSLGQDAAVTLDSACLEAGLLTVCFLHLGASACATNGAHFYAPLVFGPRDVCVVL